MLYMATGEGRFQEAGKEIVDDLAKHTRWDQDPHPTPPPYILIH